MIFEQFSKLANVYFLVMMILKMIPAVTDGGLSAFIAMFSLVVGGSMLKDTYEDCKRRIADRKENNRTSLVSRDILFVEGVPQKSFEQVMWQDIQVGSIVKVQKNEPFPCDLVLLNSSDPQGSCFVETKSLDGETNLK